MNNTITQKEINKMNVKPKFLNVMKQRIFTLMMMLALVIVTSSAFGAPNKLPLGGEKVSYVVNGIATGAAGTATLSFNGSGTNTFSNVTDQADATLSGTHPTYDIDGTVTSVKFDLQYDLNAGDGDLKLVIAITGGCTNEIKIAITPRTTAGTGGTPPSLSLAVTTSGDFCQVFGSYENADAVTGTAQSFTYTVTPTWANKPTGANFDFTFNLDDANYGGNAFTVTITSGGGTLSGSGAGPYTITDCDAVQVITVSFSGIENIASQTTVGTISSSNFDVPAISILNQTASISTASQSVVIGKAPAIGSFQ